MKHAFVAVAGALALSACEQPPAEPPEETPTATPSPISTGAGQAIPARFLGVWDYVEGDCDPASDLRMEIEPRRIVFYESVGTVTAVEKDGVEAVMVDLAMTGEGESWTHRMRLDLGEDDTVLIPGDADANQPGQPMPRRKCPS